MTLAILFVNGMCMGAAVLMGTQYGAGKKEVLRRQISTTMLAGIVFSLAVSLLFVIFAAPLLELLQVQQEVLPLAVHYLRIIFIGFLFTFIYNFFACTLRALGDSTTPLYFLMVSSVLNIVGDLFFVAVLKLGSAGCAVSTVLSEALCCLFCVIYIWRKVPELNLGKDWLIFDAGLLKQTILRSLHFPHLFFLCKTNYWPLCKRCGSNSGGRYLPASHVRHVSAPGSDKWNTGFFPWNR